VVEPNRRTFFSLKIERRTGGPPPVATPPPPPPVEPVEVDPVDLYAVRLAFNFSAWVNRRVERFEFLDGRTVLRQMSIDFTLPDDPDLDPGQPVMVPVMILRKGLRKGVLRNLDVTDADERCVTVVESDRSRDVAIDGLIGLIEAVREPHEQVDPALRAKLKADITAERGGKGNRVAKVAMAAGDELGNSAREGVDALIGELREGFLLMVNVPFAPGEPGLIKVRYDARMETSLRNSVGFGFRGGAYFLLSRFFSTFGLAGRAEYFRKLPLRLGKSYHAEFVPAPGTYAEEARLSHEELPDGSRVKTPSKEDKVAYRDVNHSRPHVWIKGGGEGTNRGERGFLEVVLHAKREGLIFPLFFSTGVIAGVLSYVSAQAEHHRLDGITLGALLLVPVAAAAYYARSDENGYLTAAMRGVRYMATIAVLAGVVVIALLALGYVEPHSVGDVDFDSDKHALVIVRCAARVAIACTVALGLALAAPILAAVARRVSARVESEDREVEPHVTLGDMARLVLPPLFLIGIGVVVYIWLLSLLKV
jgi:hypothetical protein